MVENLTYFNKYDNIDKIIQELNELKTMYKKHRIEIHMKLYIRKLMYLAKYIDIKQYLLEEIEKPIIDFMIDLDIKTDYHTTKQIWDDQELLEKYILRGKTYILIDAPKNVYDIKIKEKRLIDYLFENNLVESNIINSIIDCDNIFEYIKKYNKEDLLNDMDPSNLFNPKGNKLLLDELIESKIKPNLKQIYYTNLVNKILDRKAYYLLENVSDTLLDMKVDGITLFEYLLKKDVICKQALNNINYGRTKCELFSKIIMDYKRYDLLLDLDESVLINLSFNNKLALEYIHENNLSPHIIYNSKESLDIILKLNKYEELKKCSQKLLLVKLKNNNYVIEEVFKRQLTLEIDDITNPEIAYYIYVNNRKDLYSKVRLSTWLMEYDDKNTYLDWIIIESKQNIDIIIKDIREDKSDIDEKAKIYILFAKHKIHKKYPLTKEELLTSQNGKTLMEYLLEEDEDLTLNYLIPEELKKEKEISIIIKINELKSTQKQYKLFSKNISEKYLQELHKSFNFSRTTEDESLLLEELFNIMNDGKSDIELLYTLISFYTYLFSINNVYANEVIRLIDIKRNNPDFSLIKSSNGDSFIYKFNRIELETTNHDILAHELGHALFYYLADKNVSQKLISKIKELRNSKEFLDKTAIHSQEYYKHREKVSKMVEEYYMKDYNKNIDENEINRIKEYLELQEELRDLLGYIKFPGIKPKPEEIIKRNKEIQKQELVSFIMRTEYGYVLSVSDIIDAIHEGKYQNGDLVDTSGKEIIGCAGHGVDYYSRGDMWVMDEIIANISEIMKSSNPQAGINLLKEYIGEELTNTLIDYYEQNILYSKKYEQGIAL